MANKIRDEHGNVYVQKKPFYKRIWFIVLVGLFVISGLQSVLGGGSNSSTSSNQATSTTSQTTTETSASSSENQRKLPTVLDRKFPLETSFTLSIQKRLALT